jgi:predicted SAM-dependent methyltransferase
MNEHPDLPSEGYSPQRVPTKSLRSPETKQKVGAYLQRWPIVWKAAALTIRYSNQPHRTSHIQRYLADNQVRRLRIGAGPHTDDGWLCADLMPLSRDVVFMDATKAFPFPSRSFDRILCEHMIEHLYLRGARSMLAECMRVMRPGGVLRVATPDLQRLISVFEHAGADEESREYVTSMNSTNPDIPASDQGNPSYMLNRMVRDWGHQFLYDETTLRQLLIEEGFVDIVRCEVGQSSHADLIGVERHQEAIGDVHNKIETMVLEASAPMEG